MRILHTADWHLGAYVGPQCDDPAWRMHSTLKCLDSMVKVAKRERVDAILVCGDLIHVAKTWSDRALIETEVAAGILNQLAKIAPTVVLYGTPNHDNAAGFVAMTRMCPDVHFITEPRLFKLDTPTWEVQIAGVPGVDRGIFRAQMPGLSAEEENRAITAATADIIRGLSAQLNPEMPSILMAHHTVIGCTLDNGEEVFAASEPVIEPATLDATGFDLVALGHIHNQQFVRSCRKPVAYCGSINANSFGDEGNFQGFFIHDLFDDDQSEPGKHWYGFTPYLVPARKFVTLRTPLDAVAGMDLSKVHSAIVRVLYTGTDEQEAALDRRALERDLYAAGADHVAEIRPESVLATVNRERLHETLEPADCLRRYLDGQQVDPAEIAAIVDIAQPIIAAALANAPAGGQTGTFLPLSLEVQNYRSYEYEKLDFSAISLAMVNGRNGVGKSSLFMDALLDCLYEQPREGELTGWIRAGERSGSIMFKFQLGQKIWRVTRTRARSGKATLALAELLESVDLCSDAGVIATHDDWEDHSGQRMADTQQAIVNLLGMDADTFRSCVLIMQDAYGSFMEAKPEDRMAVLANLLGLGIYEAMEDNARAQLQAENRTLRELKSAAESNEQERHALEPLVAKLAIEQAKAEELQQAISGKQAQRDELAARSADVLAVKTDIWAAEGNIAKWQAELFSVRSRIQQLETNLIATGSFVANAPRYEAAHEEYQQISTTIAGLQGYMAQLKDMESRQTKLQMDIISASDAADAAGRRAEREQAAVVEISEAIQKRNAMGDVEAAHDAQIAKKDAHQKLQQAMTALSHEQQQQESLAQVAIMKATRDVEDASMQRGMLQSSGCIDISRAECKFLAEAKLIAGSLLERQDVLTAAQQRLADVRTKYANEASVISDQMDALGYNAELDGQRYEDFMLARKLDMQIVQGDAVRQRYGTALADKERHEAELEAAREELRVLTGSIDALKLQLSDVGTLQTKLAELADDERHYAELPAARRYLAETEPELDSAKRRREEVAKNIDGLMAEINRLKELEASLGDSAAQLGAIDADIRTLLVDLSASNREIGSLEMQTGKLAELATEAKKLSKDIQTTAQLSARLSRLVAAFCQDGIPHQIIRDIVPDLQAQANEILGNMTAGRMRLQYRTEKTLKSNKNKEVATLDIVLTDTDSGDLPYLSRSGGQKVRAALAQSFAMAMIKASRVGLQLGFLFIDEPPGLDEEGTEGYCAALETIHNMIPGMKVIAISHDERMKARFAKQILIVNTPNGSKVVMS